MKIPGLGKIATFALKHIVIPAIGRAVKDDGNPLTATKAKQALEDAVQAEVGRQVGRRVGI